MCIAVCLWIAEVSAPVLVRLLSRQALEIVVIQTDQGDDRYHTRGHARPHPPRREVLAPRGQGHTKKGWRHTHEKHGRPEVKQPLAREAIPSPRPVPAGNTLQGWTAIALYHNLA